MENTLNLDPKSDRDVFYYRQRHKNRVFQSLVAFFATEAERRGLTKKDLAERLKRDPAQITRWLSSPSNLTLDTISDILLSLDAEMDHTISRFEDRPNPNYMHEFYKQITETIVNPTRPPKKLTSASGSSPSKIEAEVG